jgi:hypothetical protein
MQWMNSTVRYNDEELAARITSLVHHLAAAAAYLEHREQHQAQARTRPRRSKPQKTMRFCNQV